MKLISSIVACVLSMCAMGQRAPTKDVKAAWIPVQELCTTESQCSSTMATLKAQGVNRVYVDVWNQGRTFFYSNAMMKLVGPTGIATDQLAWEVKYAKQNGMQVWAWFEYGLMAAYLSVNNDFARKAQSLGWISGTAYDFVWLKPIDPVNNFIADIMIDAITGYKLDGVQLDDHFAWPTSLPGSNANAMTTAMQTVYNRIRAVSSLPISLSPNTISDALSKYNVDWVKWGNMGIYSEVAPQLYRSYYSDFKAELDRTLAGTPSSLHTYMISGLRCNGAGASTAWTELEKMMDYTKTKNLGASVWFAKCITQTYYQQFKSKWGSSLIDQNTDYFNQTVSERN